MTRPTLYVFAISHYCERARWALDACSIEYDLKHLAPGPHLETAQRIGAPASSLPFLETGTTVVQGSGAILDWVERARPVASTESLQPAATYATACAELERRFDEVVGVHIRRMYYSESLVEHPETVLPVFLDDLDPDARPALEGAWPFVQQVMIESMDLGAEQREESRRIVEGELDAFDALVSDGRRYLFGERFSRADVTAASLLAPLAVPPEHPTYGRIQLAPLTRGDMERWADRPGLDWVRRTYRVHRAAPTTNHPSV